jgi:hypothetical protein
MWYKWYKVPTMLLEKESMHTEILFVHCCKFFFIITCSFSVFVENCILLPMSYKWICCVPVYFTCIVLIFYPFTQIFIISHKGTIFSQNKILFQSAFCFRYKNVASKSFYQNKIHPFPLMLMQINEMWYTYTPLGI